MSSMRLSPAAAYAAVVLIGMRLLARPAESWGSDLRGATFAGLITLAAAAFVCGEIAALLSHWLLERRGKPDMFLPNPYVEAHWERRRESFFEGTGWPLRRNWVGWHLTFELDPGSQRPWSERRWESYWRDRHTAVALLLANLTLVAALAALAGEHGWTGAHLTAALLLVALQALWWRLLAWRAAQARREVLAVEWLHLDSQRQREELEVAIAEQQAAAAEGGGEKPGERKGGMLGKLGGALSGLTGLIGRGNVPYNVSYGALSAILDRWEKRRK